MCEGATWIHVSIFFCLCVSENLCTPLVRMDARALTFHARARTDKHAHLRTHALTHVNTHTHTAGSAVAIMGVLLYSLAEEAGKKKAKAH